MKVRLLFTALGLLGLFTFVGYSLTLHAQGPATSFSGRFQLFQGRYQINAGGSSVEGMAVFKIDSQTGQTFLDEPKRAFVPLSGLKMIRN